MLRVYQTVRRIRTLGPYDRFGLWLQGCERNCPGCISPEAGRMDGGYLADEDTLAGEILSVPDIEGITVSGGEPFLQAEALEKLLCRVRREKDLGVILYTGYTYEEVAGHPLLRQCDALIDGPYIKEADDGRSMRGSSNQRLIHLSERYRGKIEYGEWGRKTQMAETDRNEVVMVGVPSGHSADFARYLRDFWKGGPDGDH